MAQTKNQLHKDLLRVLRHAKAPLRKAILSKADKALIYSICEICENILCGNVALSPPQKSKLKKHKSILKRLVDRKEPWTKKKEALTQTGGSIIPLLLSVLAPTLGKLIFGE